MSIWRSSTTGILIAGVLAIIIASTAAFMVLNFKPTTEVRVGTGVFQTRIADNEASLQQGLSGVEKLKPNEGLLMIFASDDTWGIWMKDMKIPLDIVWLDSNKSVVNIVKNASPELSTTKTFTPVKAARYVIELPEGSVVKNSITIGDKATFTVPGENK